MVHFTEEDHQGILMGVRGFPGDRMERIKDNIYVETEFLGCNPSFVVTSNGIVMIDVPGLRPLEALKWKKEDREVWRGGLHHQYRSSLGPYLRKLFF